MLARIHRWRRRAWLAAALAALAPAAGAAGLPPSGPAGPPLLEPEPGRGALLYDTHCIACHTAQVHWRDAKQARDWATLKAEVIRWQAAAALAWTDAEVDEVTRYLNDSIYHFPVPQEQAGRGRSLRR